MGQFSTDFSGGTPGSMATGFTDRYAHADWYLETVTGTGTLGDKYVRLENGGAGGSAGLQVAEYDAPGAVSVAADATIEALVKFRCTAFGSEHPVVAVFTDGASGLSDGYAPTIETDQFSIMRYNSSGDQAARVATDTTSTRPAANEWWWVRFRVESGSTWRLRFWKDGDAEPGAWNCSGVDSTLTTGRIGLPSVSFLEEVHWDYLAVGTDSDGAPSPGGATYPHFAQQPAPVVLAH